jgi:hypothetical protein
MLREPGDPLYQATFQRQRQDTVQVGQWELGPFYDGATYQSKGFDHQRPSSHELSNHKTPKNGLDLGYPTMPGVRGVFPHQQARGQAKHHLDILAGGIFCEQEIQLTENNRKKKYSINHFPPAEVICSARLQGTQSRHFESSS